MAKKYDFKDYPEHKSMLEPWRDKWIANAMSTKPMDDHERELCREAVVGLYAAAKLPPPKHIVFVPSPFVLAFASGFAASIWYRDRNPIATEAATEAATMAATWDATRAATEAATWDDLSKWYVVPADMRKIANALGVGDFGLQCAAQAWRMWQGGNQWSGYDAYLSFFQDTAKLPIDYSGYSHWRALAEHSGPRIMHPDFCMISDRPSVLMVDDDNRPHCDDGPFCEWRDGSKLYSVHGIMVPEIVIEHPDILTFEQVRDEGNAEIRRHMLERFGGLYDQNNHAPALQAWIDAGGLKPISSVDITHKMQPSGLSIWRMENGDKPVTCDLYRAELDGDEPLNLLLVRCTSTAKAVSLRVPPNIMDAAQARDWTFGVSLAEAVET